MVLELSGEDVCLLYDLLRAHLPELRREVARTEDRQLRHVMTLRQDLCERILARLAEGGSLSDVTTEDPRIAAPAP